MVFSSIVFLFVFLPVVWALYVCGSGDPLEKCDSSCSQHYILCLG